MKRAEYGFHPISEDYPLLEGHDFEELANDIAANGQRNPIWLFRGQIADGRNRYRACMSRGIKPWFEQAPCDEAGLKDFVNSQNLHRRHLSPQQQEIARRRRLDKVLERRQNGESLRVIAEAVDVSEAQVRRDMAKLEEEAGVPAGTLTRDDGMVVSKDGRERPARATAPGGAVEARNGNGKPSKPHVCRCPTCGNEHACAGD
jgi:ParB-like chromosome segregation protein Spo0J